MIRSVERLLRRRRPPPPAGPPPAITARSLSALILWTPFLATLGLRLLCLRAFLGSPQFLPLGGDRGLYQDAATALCQGQGWSEILSFLPLYPVLLSGLYRATGGPNLAAAAILQAVLEGGTALLIAGLARRRFGVGAGLLAGLGYAALGPAAAYSLVTMPVSLGLFWTALTATLVERWQQAWTRARAVILGLTLGAGGQVLGPFWLMLAPSALWLGIQSGPPLRRRLALSLLVMAGGAACALPTLVHNALAGGGWIPITAHGGLNLYLGNQPACSGYAAAMPGLRRSAAEMTRDSAALASRLAGKRLGPAEADRYWRQRALDFWRRQPLRALSLTAKKTHRLASVRDFDDTGLLRLLPETVRALRWTAIGFGAVWLLACAGYGRRSAPPASAGLWILGGCFAAGMLLTFVTARYRLPLAVLLLPAAAGTLTQWRTVLASAVRRLTPRRVAGLAGIVLALAPHPLPDTTLPDELNRSAHWAVRGQAGPALAHALKAARHSPASEDAWFAVGNAHMAGNDFSAAVEAYTRAARLGPERTDILFNAGRALEGQGQSGEALAVYRRVVELDPRNAKAWFALAVLYRQAGEPVQAKLALEQAATLVGWDHPDIAGFRNPGADAEPLGH